MSVDISDHALVRYIERIKCVSLEPYRNEIRALLSEHRERPIPESGYDDGILFVLEPLGTRVTVVTILTPAMRPKRKTPWSTRSMVHVPNRYRTALWAQDKDDPPPATGETKPSEDSKS